MSASIASPPLAGDDVVGDRLPIWVGEVDVADIGVGITALPGAAGYARAHVLIRDGEAVLALKATDVNPAGDVASSSLLPATGSRTRAPQRDTDPTTPISVVVCTYGRPAGLRACLTSLLAMNHPDFEVVVVDNDPSAGSAQAVVSCFDDVRLRLVTEPLPGLSRARNVGIVAARHDIVAFTDDDVTVDKHWLTWLARRFDGDAACVTGIVVAAEISSLSQWYFESRVDWNDRFAPESFRMASPPPNEPLFPLQGGRFGTGANFAVRRHDVIELGGFDERLGAGAATGGGEDLDMFFRLITSGRTLTYEPSALIWHTHRASMDELEHQVRNYGLGLGAWLAAVLTSPRGLAIFLRRVPAGVRKVRRYAEVDDAPPLPMDLGRLSRVERGGVLRGPLALAGMWQTGRPARPLARRQQDYLQRRCQYRASVRHPWQQVVDRLRADLGRAGRRQPR